MPHRVLVTGALGNIGRRVIDHLCATGHRVVALDLRTPKTERIARGLRPDVERVWGNICDPELWPRVLDGVTAVVHLAAIMPPAADRDPRLTIAVNQTATIELIRQMESSATAKRLIFASSMVVAGHEQHRREPPLRTDEEPRATDLYGRTKVQCENRIRASTLHWSILRLAVCPPNEIVFSDTSRFTAIFDTSPDGRMELVHNDDAGLAFANAINCEDAVGKVLFVGGGAQCRSRVIDFYNAMFGCLGLRPIRREVLRPGPAYFFGDWLDTDESQRLLAFQRHSLDDILAEFRAKAGYRRWLLTLVAPLVHHFIEWRSPHTNARPGGRSA